MAGDREPDISQAACVFFPARKQYIDIFPGLLAGLLARAGVSKPDMVHNGVQHFPAFVTARNYRIGVFHATQELLEFLGRGIFCQMELQANSGLQFVHCSSPTLRGLTQGLRNPAAIAVPLRFHFGKRYREVPAFPAFFDALRHLVHSFSDPSGKLKCCGVVKNPPGARDKTRIVDKHTARPASASSSSASSRRFGARLGIAFALLLLAACAALLLATAYVWRLVPQTPDIGDLLQVKKEQPSIVLAADGSELTSFRRVQREWVTLDRIAPSVVDALIATEDQRFYQHRGIDPWRIAAAVFHTATGDTQGASTITQQLARNQFPEEIGRSRDLSRKIKEMITAIRIEQHYSKRQILETYLNTVPFLYNAFGIEMAARTYFSKPAAELGPLESATLIGMLKGTRYYNPVVNPERALARRNVVLGQMARHGLLSGLELASLRQQPLQLSFNRQIEPGPGDHFTEYVRRWVSDWADRAGHDLYTGGLVVHATLDPALQA